MLEFSAQCELVKRDSIALRLECDEIVCHFGTDAPLAADRAYRVVLSACGARELMSHLHPSGAESRAKAVKVVEARPSPISCAVLAGAEPLRCWLTTERQRDDGSDLIRIQLSAKDTAGLIDFMRKAVAELFRMNKRKTSPVFGL